MSTKVDVIHQDCWGAAWPLPSALHRPRLCARRAWAGTTGRRTAVTLQHLEGSGIERRYAADVANAHLNIAVEARDFVMHGQCEDLDTPGTLWRRWIMRELVAV